MKKNYEFYTRQHKLACLFLNLMDSVHQQRVEKESATDRKGNSGNKETEQSDY